MRDVFVSWIWAALFVACLPLLLRMLGALAVTLEPWVTRLETKAQRKGRPTP